MASLDVLCSSRLNSNKISKMEHKQIFCGLWKILKNVSWLINICLKYFISRTKPSVPSSYILNVQSPRLTSRVRLWNYCNLSNCFCGSFFISKLRSILPEVFCKYAQFYWRTPTLKCDFNKAPKQLYLAYVISCKFVAFSQNIFS